MQLEDYFDLTIAANEVDSISINPDGFTNCFLQDSVTGKIYQGFILAKSRMETRFTICDVDFEISQDDGKYQPRLTFRRTRDNLEDTFPKTNQEFIRINFKQKTDGYRNFWKMVFFLYKFKERVDFGDFDEQFQVVTQQQFQNYLSNKTNFEKIQLALQQANIEVSALVKSASTLRLLKICKAKLEYFIENSSSETEVQNWIDEDQHSHRKERCMIFGLEYVDFKREGSNSGKHFDILTRVGHNNIEHVLIELKSPKDNIFTIKTSPTINGTSQEYHLNSELSRAIPQILEYKSNLESKKAGDPELVELAINNNIKISKCIIVIGTNSINTRWLQNRKNLSDSLNSSLEIWTYTDLLEKITATIKNIEDN